MNDSLYFKLHRAATVYKPVDREHVSPFLDERKFFELIVQECVKVCLAERNPPNLNYRPSDRFAEAIKLHFGIK